MGPLVPLLLLVPILGILAWFCVDVLVIGGVPVFSAACLLGMAAIVVFYCSLYSHFAKNDPDRLQSEQYRIHMQELQMIRIKEAGDVHVESLEAPVSMPDEAPARTSKSQNGATGAPGAKGTKEREEESK